jgi:hypothetical protein
MQLRQLPRFPALGLFASQLSNLELTLLDLRASSTPPMTTAALQQALRRQHRTQPWLHSAVVLLHDVIQVLTAAHLHSLRQGPAWL